jgi:uncharacterized protein (TIGR00369 family)
VNHLSRVNESDFEPIQTHLLEALRSNGAPFPALVGLKWEAIRRDYARMRLPYRPELNQPAGIVHGGAIATLIDTVVVGAVISGLSGPPARLLTLDLSIQYLDAVAEEDMIAQAWVRRRGRSIVFLAADVTTPSGKHAAHGELTYKVQMPHPERSPT